MIDPALADAYYRAAQRKSYGQPPKPGDEETIRRYEAAQDAARTVLVADTYETPGDAAQYALDEAEALETLGDAESRDG